MTVAMSGDGSFPAVLARLQPNPQTWLHFTDRCSSTPWTPASAARCRPLGGRNRRPSSRWKATCAAPVQFMRRWLTTFGRWSSPKAIAGESYGRPARGGAHRMLLEDYDINLNRAVMISPALRPACRGSRAAWPDQHDDDAAVAGGRRRLPPPQRPAGGGLRVPPKALAEVERYALGEYLTGMANLGRSTPEQKAALFGRVAALTGLDRDVVASQNAASAPTSSSRPVASAVQADRPLRRHPVHRRPAARAPRVRDAGYRSPAAAQRRAVSALPGLPAAEGGLQVRAVSTTC